jgi:predicted O-linked N-acetylglucosamine transferase (SPINDLY family)
LDRKYSYEITKLEAQRLVVGFVSGDLYGHPVGYFLEGVLKEVDRGRLELIAYPTQNKDDDLTARIKPYFSKWNSLVGLSDEEAARRIHEDGVHILIDLAGHTGYNRLPVFAYKPAPVQATWLGYFATTGVKEIDYIIGDPYVTPESEADHFVEKIWALPETYCCFSPPLGAPQVSELPALANGFVTFGCFNNLAKVNERVIALWARVLQAVPGSKLMLKTKALADEAVRRRMTEQFQAQGVEADRLILEGPSPRTELLGAYGRVDIALDPFPYPGGTTSAEALWMGVPVLTKRGDRFLSHVGETIAHNSGQSEWIAQDEAEYVQKAVQFTQDLPSLAARRAQMREKLLQSPLYDAKRFARHFRDAIADMVARSTILQSLNH